NDVDPGAPGPAARRAARSRGARERARRRVEVVAPIKADRFGDGENSSQKGTSPLRWERRRGGRVADCIGLENRQRRKTLAGSNPAPSASTSFSRISLALKS